MKGEPAVVFLRHAANATGLISPLKTIASTALEIADLAKRFKTCTDEWKEFRAYTHSAIVTMLQSIESANMEKSELEIHAGKLQAVLEGIVMRIATRQKDSLMMQLRHFLDHPVAIAEMRQEIDNAIRLFKLGTGIRTEANTERLLQLNAARALDPVMSKLQYAEGASWDPYRVCLPNTRQNIIKSVLEWVNNPDGTSIFLLTGVAGSGKSAIAHTVAQRLYETKQLATSFFFDRDTTERNNPRRLISTMVTDISQREDQLGRSIIAAIEEDKTLIGAPISRQFQHLILNPSKDFISSQPLVIVLDALDEGCDKDLLQILSSDASKLPPSLRIFLTSRMSPEVERLHRRAHVHPASLDIYEKDNMDDIALFIPYKLNEVAEHHGLDDNWPDTQLVDSFQNKAEGLFVWVATVCDYLNSCYFPTKELESLISGSDHSGSSAESKMDSLYAKILQACNWGDQEFVNSYHMLLGAAVATKSPLTLRALNALYQREIMGSELALRQLSPLVTGLTNRPTTQPVRFLHQSLREFLTLRAATISGPIDARVFAIDERTHSRALALRCLGLMNRELDSSIPSIGYCSRSNLELPGIPSPDKSVVSEELLYACQFWVGHVVDVELGDLPEVEEPLERFLNNKLLLWMEVMASYARYEGLSRVQSWAMDKCRSHPALKFHVYNENLAPKLNNLAERLRYMDRREEALITARDEVAIYRSLAADGYEGTPMGLARALCSLSFYLMSLDHHEEALSAASEAVTIQRELVTTHPEELKVDLAKSLYRLSVGCGILGRAEDALGSIEEAIQIQRSIQSGGDLATAHSADMARFLYSKSCHFSDLGRHEDALALTREVVEIRRQLAKYQPTMFTSDLASALHSLANDLSELGHTEKAFTTLQEAIELRRQLVKERPAAFTSDLADSVHNLSKYLSALGRHEEALSTIQEAVELQQQLADRRPAVFKPQVAISLHSLSYCLANLGRHEEALTTTQQAVVLLRELARQRPAVFTSHLADSLHDLSCNLSSQGSHNEALVVIQEAVTVFRQLATERPAAFNPDLAMALNQLACCLYELNFHGDALVASKESVALFRPLAQQYPAAHSSRFSSALYDLSKYLARTGNDQEALLVREELTVLCSPSGDP